MTINGLPAWASEYDLATNTFRPMEVLSNSFCAGGTVLGNGTWINVGGNQAIGYGGNAMATNQQTGQSPYGDWDGGMAVRFLNPSDDGTCNWLDDPAMYMTSRRWYPTLETLEDGSAIIIGGCQWGGYVNYADNQNNPTVEVSLKTLQCEDFDIDLCAVLAIQGHTIYPELPLENHAGQPIPSHLAPTFR